MAQDHMVKPLPEARWLKARSAAALLGLAPSVFVWLVKAGKMPRRCQPAAKAYPCQSRIVLPAWDPGKS